MFKKVVSIFLDLLGWPVRFVVHHAAVGWETGTEAAFRYNYFGTYGSFTVAKIEDEKAAKALGLEEKPVALVYKKTKKDK